MQAEVEGRKAFEMEFSNVEVSSQTTCWAECSMASTKESLRPMERDKLCALCEGGAVHAPTLEFVSLPADKIHGRHNSLR
jgi:hypothetical protein